MKKCEGLNLDTKTILWLNNNTKTRNRLDDTGPLSLKEEVAPKMDSEKLVAPTGYGEERINKLGLSIVREQGKKSDQRQLKCVVTNEADNQMLNLLKMERVRND